jgi:uncharacterized NAD(P)/FAD-binding protein YdhS
MERAHRTRTGPRLMRVDLAIVGAGLSGSRALVELIARLARGPRPARPLAVLLFDRAGEFGRGIPYGARSDRRAMLIEDLHGTRCPEFLEWVRANPTELESLREGGDDDRDWHARHAQALASGGPEALYLPRHVFGTFSVRMLETAIREGTARGLVHVVRRVEEVVDLSSTDDGCELSTASGATVQAAHALLAVGSVPRHDAWRNRLGAALAPRYVCDTDFCGSFALRQAFDRYERESPEGEVRLAIIGAAASALESLYCALHHGSFSQRIASVTTLSGSGMLPGGLRGAGDAPVSEYARLRTSAADYVRAARALLEGGRLAILAARLHSLRAHGDALRIEAERPHDGSRVIVDADLVINCSGAGRLQSTPSRLLRNLAHKLALRREGRAFATRADHSLVQWPRVFVAGPLLNGGSAASDVESISAVFRVGRELGDTLAAALAGPMTTPLARGRDAMSGDMSAEMS